MSFSQIGFKVEYNSNFWDFICKQGKKMMNACMISDFQNKIYIIFKKIENLGMLQLHEFTKATGLRINFHKSSMVPINISQDRCNTLANVFGCKVESMPFTYLGLPTGSTRPKLDDLMPMIHKIDKRVSGIANLVPQL